MAEQIFLTLDLGEGGEVPTEFRIIGAGDNPTKKGTLVFDAEAAASVLAAFEDGKVELPIDYAHAMAGGGGPLDKIAAGWFKPAVREDGSLWAVEVDWTPRAAAHVAAKEWRYTSLWGEVEKLKDGRMRLRELVNVALTNTPATKGTLPLVASRDDEPQGSERQESMTILFSALGVTDEAGAVDKAQRLLKLAADVEAVLGDGFRFESVAGTLQALKLQAERAGELEAKLSKLQADAEAEKRERLIEKLSAEGKLPPGQFAWARTQTLENLEAFARNAPPIVDTKPVAELPPSSDAVSLTAEEKRAAELFGHSEEAVLETKRLLLTAGKVV